MSIEYKECEYTECTDRFKSTLSGKNRPKRFCSMDCYNKSRTTTIKCGNLSCGVLFTCARHENRKYCSLSCAARVNNNSKGYWDSRPETSKSYTCNVCGERMRTKRRVCAECTSESKERALKDKIRLWLDGDISIASYSNGDLARWARNHLMVEANHMCTICGWCEVNPHVGRVVLTIDHVDGDWTNNAYTNLKVLCWNCHSLTPTFGSQNIGKSPRIRPSLHQTPGTRNKKSNGFSENEIEILTNGKTRKTKIDWPVTDSLIEMVRKSNYSALSKKLGVSDNAIRKRIRSMGYDPKTLERM